MLLSYQWYQATCLRQLLLLIILMHSQSDHEFFNLIVSHLVVQMCDTYTSTRSTFTPQGSASVSREDCNNKLQEQHQENISLHTSLPSLLLFPVNRDTHKFVWHIQSNISHAEFVLNQSHSTLKCTVWGHFFCVVSWFFCIEWCSFTACLSLRGKLTARFFCWMHLKLLQICPDHILS